MTLQKILFFICLIISLFISVTGYIQINFWQGEIAVLISLLLWIFARKKIPEVCLLLSIIIAVTGILLKIPALLMLLYSVLSIACWDLTLLDKSLAKNDNNQKSNLYQKLRLISLGISLGVGFITVSLGRLLNLKIHFFIMIIFVVIVFFIIDQVIHIFHEKE
jgi:uncharacterized membrane protein AbrB (regulator of aidB expression)